MRLRRIGICALLVIPLGGPLAVSAQQPSPPGAAELRRLAFLLGDWEGTGWMDMGPAGRHEFVIRESARTAAGGNVVVLDGLGVERLADGGERPVHQAFAVLSWDPERSRIRLRAFRAGGGEVEDHPEISENGLVWGFPDPRAGRVRFTVSFADGTWHEVGETSQDGTTWRQFMDMRLKRVPAGAKPPTS